MNWATSFAIVGTAWALTIPLSIFLFENFEHARRRRIRAERAAIRQGAGKEGT